MNRKLPRENVYICGFTRHKLMINRTRPSLKSQYIKGIACCVDANFANEWAQAYANNAENVMSRTGYVII